MRSLNELSEDYDPSVDAYLADFATENFEAYVESWMTAATIKENETTGTRERGRERGRGVDREREPI